MKGKLAAVALTAVIVGAVLSPNPRRGDTWTCPACGDENEEGRAQCMKGCGTAGPLATDRAKQEAEKRQGGDD